MNDPKQSFMVNDSTHFLVPPPPDKDDEEFMQFQGSSKGFTKQDPANEDTEDEREEFMGKMAKSRTQVAKDTHN